MRPLFVLIHRYIGLALAGFLAVAGLSGALLAFEHELDMALNPRLLRVIPPVPGAAPLDALALREAVLAHYPGARINRVDFATRPDEAQSFRLEWPSGIEGRDDQVFVDPYRGDILGARRWGDITQGLHNLAPFAWRLHQSLLLDKPGILLLGIVALIWTLDCFVGAYLTFPVRRRDGRNRHRTPSAGWVGAGEDACATTAPGPAACRSAGVSPASPGGNAGKGWLARWRPAWKVRWKGGGHKLNFDLHRAGGLWLWAMLLVLAWSAVGFNLREVYRPAMGLAFSLQPSPQDLPRLAVGQPDPGLGWREARATGRVLMAREARAGGFAVQEEVSLAYDATRALFRYRVRSDRDVRGEGGSTSLWFDANDGARRALFLPTGVTGGDTVTTWLFALHIAAVGGLPFKVFVCATGLAAALLSVTGAVIWWRKRSAWAKSGGLRRPALVRSARSGVSSLLTWIFHAGSSWRDRLRMRVRFSRRPS